MQAPPVVTALSLGPCPSFPTLASRYLGEYLEKIRRGVEQLDDDQVWKRPAHNLSSIGNLLLHLRGNLSLWVGQGLGGRPYDRDRAGEFLADGSHDRGQLLDGLAEVVAHCQWVFENEAEARLTETLEIQGYSIDRQGAMFHAVEHMGYHTGQILMMVKRWLGPGHSIEFYPQHQDE